MLAPGGAAAEVVEQHRLQAIDGFGEDRFGGLQGFEIVPGAAELGGLIGGQKAEDSLGGGEFARDLRLATGLVVDHNVAGIDLDEIVDQEHPDDAADIDGPVGVLGQGGGHDGDVPGVLGVFLAGEAVIDQGGAQHGAEATDLGDESDLPAQALVESFPQQINGLRAHVALRAAAESRPVTAGGTRRRTG